MSFSTAPKHHLERPPRIVFLASLMLGLALLLSQAKLTWAQPHQNPLRDTINTPVHTPTNGPTSTGTPTTGPCTQRVLLQQGLGGYVGTADTWINAYTPDFHQLNDGGLKIKGGEIQSVLIRFDLGGVLPPGANVAAAELVFYVDAFQESRSLDIAAYRILRPWDKDVATWRSAEQSVRWGAAGCNAVGQDRVADPDDITTLAYRAVWRGLDVTTSVRYWLEHPSENYGWLIKGVSASTAAYFFESSGSQVLDHRPILRIDYDICGQTPSATVTASPTATPSLTPATPTATPQPTAQEFAAIQDTYLDQWSPTRNYGGTAELRCYSNAIQKPLVKFDLSALPPQARVISAMLHLHTSTTAPSTGATIAAHRLRRSWQESSATWQLATTDVPWTVPGAGSPTEDYDAAVLSSLLVNAANREYVWDVSEAVRQWVEQGEPNAGLILIGQPGANVGYSFLSSEAKETAYRPRLVVSYYIAPPTSTPTMTPTITPSPTPTLTPTPSPTATPLKGTIVGLVYNDVNRNGVHESAESGISGVTVELLSMARQMLLRVITASDGSFTFTDLVPNTYIVHQYNRWGYRSSTGDELVTYIGAGQTVITFGDYAGGAIALPLIIKRTF